MISIVNAISLPSSFTSYSFNRERVIRDYTKLISMGPKPFYASDAGLSGGTIGAMYRNNWIAKTGNTKKVTYQIEIPVYVNKKFDWGGFIPVYDHSDAIQKEVEVFEWKIVNFPRATQMLALMEQMDKLMKGE